MTPRNDNRDEKRRRGERGDDEAPRRRRARRRIVFVFRRPPFVAFVAFVARSPSDARSTARFLGHARGHFRSTSARNRRRSRGGVRRRRRATAGAGVSFSSGDVPGDGDDDEANALAAVCVEPFEVSRGGTPSSATARVAERRRRRDARCRFCRVVASCSSSSYASRASFGVSPFPPKHSASSVATAACGVRPGHRRGRARRYNQTARALRHFKAHATGGVGVAATARSTR